MITISHCTSNDCAAVAELWNARIQDAQSCWHESPQATTEFLSALLGSGHEIILLGRDGAPAAFGIVNGPTIDALCATTAGDLYRLMLQWATRNLAASRVNGSSILGTRATSERGWIDALGDALTETPYAVDPHSGATALVQVTCDFANQATRLNQAIAELGGDAWPC